MTYLELCQAVVEEVGLSGTISSVQNQSGDYQRIVRFVKNACSQIEGRWINWRFLYNEYTFQTAQGINIYTAPQTVLVRQWDLENAFLDDLEIKTVYADDGTRYKQDPLAEDYESRPIRLVVERDNSLRFIGTPDGVYSIKIGYYSRATVLSAGNDTPAIPEQFHDIIVQDAIRRYANYDEASELKAQAIEQLYGLGGTWVRPEPGSWMHQLEADQLPSSYMHGATQGGQITVRAE